MILLFGGTSETAPLAEALAAAGYAVLVSTATDVTLDVGSHPSIERRTGRLDAESAVALIRERGIRAVVDAAHPYALQAHETAERAASLSGVPCFRYARQASPLDDEDILLAADHDAAARMAFSFGRPVLLTTGSRNLEPYAREARATGTPLYVRVLPEPESRDACDRAGIAQSSIIAARGPFSVSDNRRIIQFFSIGVLVTKDSGTAGGVPEKIEAARLENCRVVVVQRPPEERANLFESLPALIAAVSRALSE